MNAHTIRPRRGRRIATAILLPVVGMGLLTACSNSVDQTCAELDDLVTESEATMDDLESRMDALDEDDLEGVLPLFREMGENFQQLSGDLSDLAKSTKDEKLADALRENKYVFDEFGRDMISIADMDVSSIDGYFEVLDETSNLFVDLLELTEDQDFREAADYIDETCDVDVDF